MSKELTWYLYVLKCENDRYYVGIAHDLKTRISKHFFGKGAIMTEIHVPISIERIFLVPSLEREKAEFYENLITLKLHQNGKKVAGGKYVVRDDSHREKMMTKSLRIKSFKQHNVVYQIDFDLIEKLKIQPKDELNDLIFTQNSPLILISKLLSRIRNDVSVIESQLENLFELNNK